MPKRPNPRAPVRIDPESAEQLNDEILDAIRSEDTSTVEEMLDELHVPDATASKIVSVILELGNDVSELGGFFDFGVLDRTNEHRADLNGILEATFGGYFDAEWL